MLRPYMVTGNRTRPRHGVRLDTVLTATATTVRADALQPEAAHALKLCRQRDRTVAEVAANLQQPLLVTKVIIGDLIDCGALIEPAPRSQPAAHDHHLLNDLLVGLKALEVS